MPKPEKVGRVAELRERIEASDALLLAEYRGLTVSDITELRRSLVQGGARFAVIKNTLMRRAAADAGVTEMEAMLTGPSAITFVDGDPVAAAKSIVDAAKKYPSLVLKGGYLDGKVLSADEAKALASLESREVMLSKVAGLLKGEMSRAAALFVAAQSKFLSLLEAYKEKLPGEPLEAAGQTAAEAAEEATGSDDAAAVSAEAGSASPESESTDEAAVADPPAGDGAAEAASEHENESKEE